MLAIALEKEIRVLTVPDLREVHVLPNSRPRYRSIAISPDGRRLAIPALNNRVTILKLDEQQSNRVTGDHSAAITDLSFTADGKRLITASFDQTLKIWDTETGALVQTLRGHTSEILSLAISADDQLVASVSEIDGIKVWDLEKSGGASGDIPLRAVGFDSDGNIIGDLRGVTVSIDPETREPNRAQSLAANIEVDGQVNLSKLSSKARARISLDAGPPVAITPSGEYALCRRDTLSTIWRLTGDSAVKTATLDNAWFGSGFAEFSPDGCILAMITSDSLIRLYSMPSAKLFATLSGHTGASGSLSFSPDGRTLASTADDGSLRLWHLTTGRKC
jgi:WD40 repeat protein